MPLLPPEPDCFPADLLVGAEVHQSPWWAIYTRSRQEKQLMRRLTELGIPHYGPLIARRSRSPAGRVRTSYLPLFSNYVFLCGDNDARYAAVTTGKVSQCVPVDDTVRLVDDLRQLQRLIDTGAPLAPEERLEPGDLVEVKSGQFKGFQGRVVRRAGETRLVVEVQFMNAGASVNLADCQFALLAVAK